jgi:hypothetical protein
VRLHFSPASEAANDALGSLAFAIDGHICFRPGFDAALGMPFRYLLAHELTHVMQKRRGREQSPGLASIAPGEQLEQEADATAAGILKEARAPRLTPDPFSSPRMYGPAGHYYTAFYTAAAAGFDFKTANAIAFYTQLPDLVSEIDAYAQGKVWGYKYEESCISTGKSYLLFYSANREKYWQQAADRAIDEMVRAWQVQAGLHSLTGGKAQAETDYRAKVLKRYQPGELAFGLAVHAYGDSFAHRDFDKGDAMYGAPVGHGTEGVNHFLRGDTSLDPHDPDNICLRKSLYWEYALALYDIFLGKSPNQPAVSRGDFEKQLPNVSNWSHEEKQEQELLSGLGAIYGQADAIYYPPDDSVPWSEFQKHPQPNQMPLAEDTKDRALQYAAEWCGSAEPFKVSVHMNWQALLHNVENIPSDIRDTFGTVSGANLSPTDWIRGIGGM